MPSLRKLPHNIHNKRKRENLTAKKKKKKRNGKHKILCLHAARKLFSLLLLEQVSFILKEN